MSKQQLSTGISLASEKKSLVRRALLCRTGTFDGLYGQVTVSKSLLDLIAAKYLADKENPTNPNDFAPILIDHNRSADLCKGRLLAKGISVEEWKEIDGEMEFGLYGDLRIDDADAQANVDSGKYAQLSISFDEETGELFEVSFVAVEAARGAIVLANKPQGGNRMGAKNLAQLQAKHTALKSAVGDNRKKRKAALSALMTKAVVLQKEIVALDLKSKEIALTVKTGQVRARLNEFVKGAKMPPAELKLIDVKALAALDEKTLSIVLGSYDSRSVSPDAFQYGQKSDKKVVLDLSPAKMREAMKLQKSGKGVALAAEDDKEDKDKKDDKNLAEGEEDKDKKDGPMSHDDLKACLAEMEIHHGKLSETMSKMKDLCEGMKSLSEEDDSGEEQEMAAEDKEAEDKENKDKKEGEE